VAESTKLESKLGDVVGLAMAQDATQKVRPTRSTGTNS